MKAIYRAFAVVIPTLLGMGLLYLHTEGYIGIATTLAGAFALAAICFTLAFLSAEGTYQSHEGQTERQ